jgi:type VI secretion system protein ImpI
MTLTLTVTSYKGASPSEPASISIEQAGISIGRHKGNSLVLNDPEQVVSSKHAEIEYRNNGYYITDTSTNHTLIDQADKEANNTQTLKGSQSAKLNNNHLLTIGDYKFRYRSLVSIAILLRMIPALEMTMKIRIRYPGMIIISTPP